MELQRYHVSESPRWADSWYFRSREHWLGTLPARAREQHEGDAHVCRSLQQNKRSFSVIGFSSQEPAERCGSFYLSQNGLLYTAYKQNYGN